MTGERGTLTNAASRPSAEDGIAAYLCCFQDLRVDRERQGEGRESTECKRRGKCICSRHWTLAGQGSEISDPTIAEAARTVIHWLPRLLLY
ncbi:hypothetical protein chiPu_0016788 [Chiloscyllium punctatum]|uniref:Uncharacterized protein n=1 Tax=Chiloscyllium punctatum TaxID=137246 RepID=A0A401T6Q6_CHIPU|nr:hypothetical protein [Chiloscyllium punctatum]